MAPVGLARTWKKGGAPSGRGSGISGLAVTRSAQVKEVVGSTRAYRSPAGPSAGRAAEAVPTGAGPPMSGQRSTDGSSRDGPDATSPGTGDVSASTGCDGEGSWLRRRRHGVRPLPEWREGFASPDL